MERIACDDLDVVWLTEVWGNRKSLKRLAERFTAIGFNYSVLQGSLSPDRSRRTGGIVALFRRSAFKYVRWIDVGSTSRLDHLGISEGALQSAPPPECATTDPFRQRHHGI